VSGGRIEEPSSFSKEFNLIIPEKHVFLLDKLF
jgi:hypothetical protein